MSIVQLRINSHTTSALKSLAQKALQIFVQALNAAASDIILEPGDMIIIDNHIAAHGRTHFFPYYDGKDRWLRRVFASKSIPAWAHRMQSATGTLPDCRTLLSML
ncbi:MAG: TauD/TfdA family dioxygenase [Mycobacteriaceae bacterium]